MKHETRREETIDSFKISIDDLAELIDKLGDEFTVKDNLYISIELEFGQEKWEFDNVQEIKDANISDAQCHEFNISMIGDNENFYISKNLFTARSEISASGDKASWCAGIIEIAKLYLKNHRPPLFWIGRFWTTILLFFPLGILLMYYIQPTDLPTLNGIFSIIIFCALLIGWRYVKMKLAPTGLIFLKEKPERVKTKEIFTEWGAYVGFFILIVGAIEALIDLLKTL